jgi:hypothetical protein
MVSAMWTKKSDGPVFDWTSLRKLADHPDLLALDAEERTHGDAWVRLVNDASELRERLKTLRGIAELEAQDHLKALEREAAVEDAAADTVRRRKADVRVRLDTAFKDWYARTHHGLRPWEPADEVLQRMHYVRSHPWLSDFVDAIKEAAGL